MLRVVAIIDSSLSKRLAVHISGSALSCCVKANTSVGASDNGQWL